MAQVYILTARVRNYTPGYAQVSNILTLSSSVKGGQARTSPPELFPELPCCVARDVDSIPRLDGMNGLPVDWGLRIPSTASIPSYKSLSPASAELSACSND